MTRQRKLAVESCHVTARKPSTGEICGRLEIDRDTEETGGSSSERVFVVRARGALWKYRQRMDMGDVSFVKSTDTEK